MSSLLFQFAEALRGLLAAPTPEAFERIWQSASLGELGWRALHRAWRRDEHYGERAVREVDGLLLKLLERVPRLARDRTHAALRLKTFRSSELERLQHAAAAALVAQRFGAAGLRTVLEDDAAPFARRYFSFFSLAERHPPREWPVFATFLVPDAHHAFMGAAAETARFYPAEGAAQRLVALFDATRSDLHLRCFLSPRILESLFVLNDPGTLPFLRGLLTSGYTDRQPDYCEVTRALVMIRRFTGSVEPNVKFFHESPDRVARVLDAAQRTFDARKETLHPVMVI
jgi:hypothetical protein